MKMQKFKISYFFQVVSRDSSGQALLAAHYRVDGHPFINPIQVKRSLTPLSPGPIFTDTLIDTGGRCWR